MAQQEETATDQKPQQQSSEPGDKQQPSSRRATISKKVSDHLANERTFLAWIRTGIAVMAFGFVVERFGLLLRELGLKFGNSGASASTTHYSKLFGITITLLGIVLLVVALINFLHVQKTIDEERYHPGAVFAIILTVIAAVIGVLLAIYLLIST